MSWPQTPAFGFRGAPREKSRPAGAIGCFDLRNDLPLQPCLMIEERSSTVAFLNQRIDSCEMLIPRLALAVEVYNDFEKSP
jgi:hypothetical protein